MDLDDFVERAKDMSDEQLEEALLQVRANRRLRPERKKAAASPKEPKAATPKLIVKLNAEDADLIGDL